MGIQRDLRLVGNDFSNIATFLFVGLLCFEIPNSTLSMTLSSLLGLTPDSLLPSDGPCGKMARSQCRSLGYRNG